MSILSKIPNNFETPYSNTHLQRRREGGKEKGEGEEIEKLFLKKGRVENQD